MLWRTITKLRRAFYRWAFANLADPSECEHAWEVYSTARLPKPCLELQCNRCFVFGSVEDPSIEEWSRAFSAPSKSYLWYEPARVTIGVRKLPFESDDSS